LTKENLQGTLALAVTASLCAVFFDFSTHLVHSLVLSFGVFVAEEGTVVVLDTRASPDRVSARSYCQTTYLQNTCEPKHVGCAVCCVLFVARADVRPTDPKRNRLLAMDLLARASMKNAANCDT